MRYESKHVDFIGYIPPPEDEEGLTPRQAAERRASARRALRLRYAAEMDLEKARAVMALPAVELMRRLCIDGEQAEDLRELARRQLERSECEEESND